MSRILSALALLALAGVARSQERNQIRIAAEDLAQGGHLHVQRRFLDHHLRPHAVEQFVLGDEMSGAIDQCGQ